MIAILWRAGARPIVPARAKRPSSPRQGLGPFPREGGILTPPAAYGLTSAGPGDGGGGPCRFVGGRRRSRAPSHCRYFRVPAGASARGYIRGAHLAARAASTRESFKSHSILALMRVRRT